MKEPKRQDNKYWDGTRYRPYIYEEDLEEYLIYIKNTRFTETQLKEAWKKAGLKPSDLVDLMRELKR